MRIDKYTSMQLRWMIEDGHRAREARKELTDSSATAQADGMLFVAWVVM